MEENKDLFLTGCDTLLYLTGQLHKNIPQYLSEAIHLVRT